MGSPIFGNSHVASWGGVCLEFKEGSWDLGPLLPWVQGFEDRGDLEIPALLGIQKFELRNRRYLAEIGVPSRNRRRLMKAVTVFLFDVWGAPRLNPNLKAQTRRDGKSLFRVQPLKHLTSRRKAYTLNS